MSSKLSKRIWIVNCYTGSPEKCGNPRYLEFAKYFMDAGHDVTIFNAQTVEKIISPKDFIEADYDGIHFVHVKNPQYVGNGLKRVLSIWAFAWRLYRNCLRFDHPDIVLHNIHTPFDYPILWMSKKLKARYIAEAWDPWPEAFVTFGLLSEKSLLMKIAYKIEYHLYKKADELIFTYEGGLDYLKEKKWTVDTGGKIPESKVHYVNNGVNIEKFDSEIGTHSNEDVDLSNDQCYKIVYLGSMRFVNHVIDLIRAAEILKNDNRYKFLLYGDGNERPFLEEYVKKHHLSNIIFKEKRIPLSSVPYVVSHATINIMNYQKEFGKHGVSSGKMFQYFAAGKPILCNVSLKYSEISRHNLGIDSDINTASEYADNIRALCEQTEESYRAMCLRVRECATCYDYKLLSERELKIITK